MSHPAATELSSAKGREAGVKTAVGSQIASAPHSVKGGKQVYKINQSTMQMWASPGPALPLPRDHVQKDPIQTQKVHWGRGASSALHRPDEQEKGRLQHMSKLLFKLKCFYCPIPCPVIQAECKSPPPPTPQIVTVPCSAKFSL